MQGLSYWLWAPRSSKTPDNLRGSGSFGFWDVSLNGSLSCCLIMRLSKFGNFFQTCHQAWSSQPMINLTRRAWFRSMRPCKSARPAKKSGRGSVSQSRMDQIGVGLKPLCQERVKLWMLWMTSRRKTPCVRWPQVVSMPGTLGRSHIDMGLRFDDPANDWRPANLVEMAKD